MLVEPSPSIRHEFREGNTATAAFRWLRALGARFPQEFAEFACCFERVDGSDPSVWIAIGRLASIVADVREGAVAVRLESGSRLLSRQASFIDDTELPYHKLFSALASALRTERALLPSINPAWDASEARHLQWFGGWKYLPAGRSVSKAACFNLPRLAIHMDAAGVRIYNWAGLPEHDVAQILRDPGPAAPHAVPAKQALIADRLVPDWTRYYDAARTVINALARHECEKIVLSRKRVLEFSRPLDPLDLYARITSQGGHAYQYLMSLEEDETWVGISPELLLRRSGSGIETRPLAGSRRRGSSAAQDQRERDSLLASEKDGREHDIAAGHMFRRLQSICDNTLKITRGRHIAKLSYIQHLATEMTGRLDSLYDAMDALSCIYPPATILGIPEHSAEALIRSCEPFDRGFFTGGMGVLSSNGDCEIALCIRSAVVKGRELHLYGGSGYVEGSSPEDEWRETETKMQPFVDLAQSLLANDGIEAGAAR